MTVALDPATIGPGGALSNANLTITHNDVTKIAFRSGARANVIQLTGKWWFEIDRAGALGLGGDNAVGGVTRLATPDYEDLGAIGNALNGAITFRSGQTFVNAVFARNCDSGRFMMFAIDLDNHLMWVRESTSANGWNTVHGDPDAGTLGIDISSIDGLGVYPAGVVTYLNALTFNFGATVPVNTPPTTFQSWDTPPPPPPAPTQAVQLIRMAQFFTTATATAVGGPVSATLLAREEADGVSSESAPTVGVILAATEAADGFAVVPPAQYNVGGLNTPDALVDDDVIYVLENNETIFVPGDFSSSFVIPTEDTLLAD